jgi:dTDP-4-dehydrorhamnose reductase
MKKFPNKKVLILGIDSIVGSALYNAINIAGGDVYGTSRRGGSDHSFLDVTFALDKWPDMPEVDSMIVCASLGKLAQCQSDPALSYAVNVEGLEKAVRKYKTSRTQVVFFSSYHVFNGRKAFVEECEMPEPQCVIGRHKAQAEEIVLNEQGFVIRVTKVIDPLYPRFTDWALKLRKGQIVEAYSNLFCSLVPLDSVIEAVLVAIREGWKNIIHLSGPEETSYYDIARMLAKKLGCSEDLVVPVQGKIDEMGVHYSHSTLQVSKVIKNMKLNLPDTEAVIREWIKGYKDWYNLRSDQRVPHE